MKEIIIKLSSSKNNKKTRLDPVVVSKKLKFSQIVDIVVLADDRVTKTKAKNEKKKIYIYIPARLCLPIFGKLAKNLILNTL